MCLNLSTALHQAAFSVHSFVLPLSGCIHTPSMPASQDRQALAAGEGLCQPVSGDGAFVSLSVEMGLIPACQPCWAPIKSGNY